MQGRGGDAGGQVVSRIPLGTAQAEQAALPMLIRCLFIKCRGLMSFNPRERPMHWAMVKCRGSGCIPRSAGDGHIAFCLAAGRAVTLIRDQLITLITESID